jgi:NAD(P)H dehydrogenase (quinone)
MERRSHPTTDNPIHVLVLFYSRFGVLRLLAEHIAQGAHRLPNVDVTLLEVEDQPVEELRQGETRADMRRRRAIILEQLTLADALVMGAPAYFGSMASPVKRVFEDCLVASGSPPAEDRSRPWRALQLRDKIGAAFTSSGTPHGGNEQALHLMLTLFMHLGMIVVTPGQAEPILQNQAAPYGATAITGANADRLPSAIEQEAAMALGERVARMTTWLKLGRTEWERRHPPERAEKGLPRFNPLS